MSRWEPVLGNSQRLDGGAMFGNAPRALWSRWVEPDAAGLIPLATRALAVVEDAGRVVLLETGVGACFPPELAARYGVTSPVHELVDNLAAIGITPDDVDVIVVSHLHFDHAGGLLSAWSDGAGPSLAFPGATVVVSDDAWARARHPHVRDRDSFLPGLVELLDRADRLEVVEGERSVVLGDDYRLHRSDGHTPGLLLTEFDTTDGPLLFASDLVPGMPWVHAPITMGYDRFPELVVDEKLRILGDLAERGGLVCFTHDPDVAVARICSEDGGRFRAEPVDFTGR